MSAAQRADWQARLSQMAILNHLGVRLDLVDDQAVRLVLERRTPAHEGGLGTERLNGAMIAGMMDCAMSIAGILHFRGRTCGTVQLSIQFMKPVRCKMPVVECRAMRRASGVVFLEAQLLEENRRCAVMATGMVGVTRIAAHDGGGDGRENWHAPVGVDAAAAATSAAEVERTPSFQMTEE
ncbi:PaaI family thioesterase [Trinickia violacea]|uniref:PaaI family thioesterase n=2 Tax=Trinickia violacea TaxID=2571746 RepID=A0A4P8J0G5_9BURK|nr:PaaI family thioesterase [Trinickia violacea]